MPCLLVLIFFYRIVCFLALYIVKLPVVILYLLIKRTYEVTLLTNFRSDITDVFTIIFTLIEYVLDEIFYLCVRLYNRFFKFEADYYDDDNDWKFRKKAYNDALKRAILGYISYFLIKIYEFVRYDVPSVIEYFLEVCLEEFKNRPKLEDPITIMLNTLLKVYIFIRFIFFILKRWFTPENKWKDVLIEVGPFLESENRKHNEICKRYVDKVAKFF